MRIVGCCTRHASNTFSLSSSVSERSCLCGLATTNLNVNYLSDMDSKLPYVCRLLLEVLILSFMMWMWVSRPNLSWATRCETKFVNWVLLHSVGDQFVSGAARSKTVGNTCRCKMFWNKVCKFGVVTQCWWPGRVRCSTFKVHREVRADAKRQLFL